MIKNLDTVGKSKNKKTQDTNILHTHLMNGCVLMVVKQDSSNTNHKMST